MLFLEENVKEKIHLIAIAYPNKTTSSDLVAYLSYYYPDRMLNKLERDYSPISLSFFFVFFVFEQVY